MAKRRRGKSSKSGSRRNWWQMAGIAAVVVAIALTAVAFAVSATRPEPESATAYVPPTLDLSEVDNQPAPDLRLVGAEIASAPSYTITVIGDSTGAPDGSWPHQIGQRIAALGHTVTLHQWAPRENRYATEQRWGTGRTPVTIWNGSAPGEGIDYSIENFAALTPQQSDLVIVNHGHNESEPGAAATRMTRLTSLLEQAWPEPPTVAMTLQNPRKNVNAKNQPPIVNNLTGWATRRGMAIIDVYHPFEDSPDRDAMMQVDQVHPNDAGQTFWANIVGSTLGV